MYVVPLRRCSQVPSLGIKELKGLIKRLGGSSKGVVEKGELVTRAQVFDAHNTAVPLKYVL